jgi:thiamine biosynthesis protein ThiI
MSLADMKELSFEKQHDRFYIKLDEFSDVDEILFRLKGIPGIHNFSLVKKVEKDIEKVCEASLEIMQELENEYLDQKLTFKVKASRSDKDFPLISDEINRKVATVILKNSNFKVDVHNPLVYVKVEIRYDAAYVSIKNYEGLGGLPLGSSGNGLLMISGGIDSPVAGYMMMKRGVKIAAIHYASPPYTSDMAIYKVKTLLKKLAKVQGEIKFINIPFTKLQLAIYDAAGDKYAITLMRRMMYRIADRVAKKHNLSCIINGESIGQVASQTLESMGVINEVTNSVIIRPLAVFDKSDIIKISKDIDTYETSIMPYEDCCTIFDPKNPTTKPKLSECEKHEAKFDFEALIEEAIENAEIEIITVE